MGCVSWTSIGVLINGAASDFFNPKRGLHQGCPLSPMLFLLAAKGLSLVIKAAKRQGDLKGIEVGLNLWVTHLLFIDDILLFCDGSQNDYCCIRRILEIFLKATGLVINDQKPSITTAGLSLFEVNRAKELLSFEAKSLHDLFKYLGFFLKPDSYKVQDWSWILANIEDKMKHWSFKWLSSAGRFVLIKSMVFSIHVY